MINVPLDYAGVVILAVVVITVAAAVVLYRWWNRKAKEMAQ